MRSPSKLPRTGSKPALGAPPLSLDDLSEAQLAAISRLRAVYLEAGGQLDEHGQVTLTRHLFKAKWDEAAAAKEAVKAAVWRRDSGADDIRRRIRDGLSFAQFPNAQKMLGCCVWLPLVGQARNGDALSFLFLGSLEVDTWLKAVSDDEFYQLNMWILEMTLLRADQLSTSRRRLLRSTTVFDAGGISAKLLGWAVLHRLKPCLPLADLYYPELVGCALCVNAPWLFHQVWGVVRRFLSKELQSRVQIVGNIETPAILEKLTPLEEVPNLLPGGTLSSLPAAQAQMLGLCKLDAATRDGFLVSKYRGGVFTLPSDLVGSAPPPNAGDECGSSRAKEG